MQLVANHIGPLELIGNLLQGWEGQKPPIGQATECVSIVT